MKNWAQEIGKKVGFAYAEGFRKITLREIHPEQSEIA